MKQAYISIDIQLKAPINKRDRDTYYKIIDIHAPLTIMNKTVSSSR